MNALTLIAALSAAPLAQDAPTQPLEAKTVIVTAKRLDVTEKALKDCIARGCPPDQEIDAALAHAENQFVDGDYFEARSTLSATIGHVAKHAKTYPEQVGDIYRARARIAAHMGERDQMRIGQFQSLDAVREGMSKNDPRVFGQRIGVADTLLRQGKLDLAVNAYRSVARDAAAAGVLRAQGTALLRVALIYGSIYEVDRTLAVGEVRRSVKDILDTTAPELAVYRAAAKLLQGRLSIDRKDTAAIDRLVAEFSPKDVTKPLLIYEPPQTPYADAPRLNDGRAPEAASDNSFSGQWVDVAFRITPAGHVHDVQIVRKGSSPNIDWIKPIVESIGGRRYAPMTISAEDLSLRRVERFTLTAYWETPTGSRLRSRGYPRIETLDLSVDVSSASVEVEGSRATPVSRL